MSERERHDEAREDAAASGEEIDAAPIETLGDAGSEPAAAEMAAIRDLILTAYPDSVAEMVGGGSVGELLASVARARSAFAAVRARLEPVGTVAATPLPQAPPIVPVVPAGATTALIDPGNLPTEELIRRGLALRQG